MDEQIVIVNDQDQELGCAAKLAVHESGQLHRAFSIFIFNRSGQVLLQKRAASKYHSGGLWTNACCGHQRCGETLEQSAERRLEEEMGITCSLEHKAFLIYRTAFPNGLTEHELDHVFFGSFDGEPAVNPDEADDWAWRSLEEVRRDLSARPEAFTFWFKEIMATQAGLFN